jgi:flap endonuclease-1
VATQDYDALLCGAPVVIRNMGVTGKRKLPYRNAYVNVEPERFETENVLRELNLTQKQRIWLGMLVGTDFNEKIPMIGPKKALKAVEGKKSFEDVLAGLKKTVDYDPHEIEEMFLHPSVFKNIEFSHTKMDREKVIAFYCDKHGFDHVRVNNALNKIEKKPEDEKQTALSKWG